MNFTFKNLKNNFQSCKILFLILVWGGVFYSDSTLSAQCSPYMFEICKVNPAPNLATNTPTTPSAFSTYYTVAIRRLNGAPLPQTLTLNYLEFHGKISVNGFSSRINKSYTTQYSQTLPGGAPSPFFPLLAYVPENGEITWTLGSYESCSDVINQDDDILQLYPAGSVAPTSVTLFTIVVDGESGDMVKWIDKGGTYSDCVVDCNADVTVSECGPGGAGLPVTFPVLNSCSPAQTMQFGLVASGGGQHISVSLKDLSPGFQNFNRLDGIIHLDVATSGVPDLDFAPQAVSQPSGATPLTFDFYVRKNADGSYDIFYSLTSAPWMPHFSTENIILIEIIGQTNLSQGVSVSCALTASRAFYTTNGTVNLCSLSAVDTEVTLPGYPQCPNKLQIAAFPEFGLDCSLSINHTINMVAGMPPITFSDVKIVLQFILEGNNGAAGTVYSNLPDANTYGVLTNTGSGIWQYKYERNTSVTIDPGDFINVPFTLNSNCIRYYIVYAEGTVAGASSPCSFSSRVDLNNWPACSPEISNNVVLPGFFGLPAPWVGMTLRSVPLPYYSLYTDSDCMGTYSFCPDQDFRPFTLQPVDISGLYHCACGVTAYDLVLISRHLSGVESLQKPYPWIAANVDETYFGQGPPTQKISQEDLNEIQECLQGLNYATHDNYGIRSAPSWRYFKDEFTSNNSNPLLDFPYTGSDIANVPVPNDPTSSYGLFTAVKMGDVDQSCKCAQKPAYATDNITVSYVVNTDGTIRADFRNGNTSSMAAQWAIRFSAQDFKVVDVKPNYSVNVNDASLGLTGLDEGILRFLWFSPDGSELIEANELLFSLVFERKENSGSSPMEMPELITADEVLSGRTYNASGEEQLVKISTIADSKRSLAFIVQPNPLIDFADLFIDSQNEADASVRVETPTGFVLFEQNSHLQQGSNVLRLQLPNLVPGSYYISIYDGKNIIRRQVIKSGL
jgi:hypothetical protein